MRPKGSAEELERRRRRAVDLLRNGCSQDEVARLVGSSQSSVSRWWKLAQEGDDALSARPQLGPEPRLSLDNLKKLEGLLAQGATAHGWQNDLWTCPRVRELIRRHFRIEYHVDHIRKILVQRLGWTSQKPAKRARERDEEEIKRWKLEKFRRLKKTPVGGAQRSSFSTNPGLCSLRQFDELSRPEGRHRSTTAGIGETESLRSAPSR